MGDPHRHSPLPLYRYHFIVDQVRQYVGTVGKRALYRDALYALAAVSRADPRTCPFGLGQVCGSGCEEILRMIVAYAYEVTLTPRDKKAPVKASA
jgi:hypothetical protein